MPSKSNEKSFSLLCEVGNELAKGVEPNRVLQQVIKMICEHTQSTACSFSVLEAKEGRVNFRASFGLYLEEMQNFQLEHSITGLAFSEGTTQNVTLSDQNLADVSSLSAVTRRFRSILAVPLIAGGRTIGVLTAARSVHHAYPQRLVALLEALAPQLASFILCAHLSKQLTETSNTLNSLNRDRDAARSKNAPGQLLRGKPIVSGVSLGRAVLIADTDFLNETLPPVRGAGCEQEKLLLEKAIAAAAVSLGNIRQEVQDLLEEADAEIFEMHAMLLEDPTLKARILKHLEAGYDLTTALRLTMQEFSAEYQAIEDEYLRERLADVKDVLLRLKTEADNLGDPKGEAAGQPAPQVKIPDHRIILVARELLPSQLLTSPVRQVCGIICESGGTTSHAAILARALRIPMLCNVTELLKHVMPGMAILLDCQSGNCFLTPDKETIHQYQHSLSCCRGNIGPDGKIPQPIPLDDHPQTADGTPIYLAGNVTLFSEMPALAANGIQDVGLYRTEFMFAIRNVMPDEDEQVRVLSRLVTSAGRGSVTIRALDVGGDKPLSYIDWGHEENPSLGWRGLRFLLSQPDFFLTHLRAILRAASQGQGRLLFPMVSEIHDLRQVKKMVEEARRGLLRDGIFLRQDIPLGMMLEVPSAVQALDKLLPEVDFVSIGSNDLIQYLFAVDRGNSRVNNWFRQLHPVVFRTLQQICRQTGSYPDKPVSICGELGSNLLALPALLGCGLRNFSMNPHRVPPIREYIRRLQLDECRSLADQVCNADTEQDTKQLLKKFAEKHNVSLL